MYVKFPKSFANEIAPKLDAAKAILSDCLVYSKPLTIEQWSELNSILTVVQVGLRSDEEHAKIMKQREVQA